MPQKFQLPHWGGVTFWAGKIKTLTWNHHPKPPGTQACHPSSHPQLLGHWPICRPSSKAGPRIRKKTTTTTSSHFNFHQINSHQTESNLVTFLKISTSSDRQFFEVIFHHSQPVLQKETVSGRGRKKWRHGLLRSIFFPANKIGDFVVGELRWPEKTFGKTSYIFPLRPKTAWLFQEKWDPI